MIKINGKQIDEEEIRLQTYLEENGFLSEGRIAVECNEVIIPRAEYGDIVFHSGDVVEIVSFVGGG